jgi:ribonuclease D
MEFTRPLSEALLRQGLPASMPKEQLNLLPLGKYEGPIEIISLPEQLPEALLKMEGETVIGFDTETRPSFRKGESYLPSLLQAATADTVYLFQLKKLDCAVLFDRLLAQPAPLKAGIALAHDLKMLQRLSPFQAQSVLDLGQAAHKHGIVTIGLRSLTAIFMGFRVSKAAQVSDWSQPNLTPSQVQYAATDAWVCRELYLKFRDMELLPPGL